MSLGCYLEFINRSFKSIIVNVNIREAKQWEKNSDSPDIVYNNRKIYDYDSSDMEMNEFLTDCNGEFNFEIEVEDENGITKKQEVMPGSGVKFFNLKEGRQSNVRRSVYYFVDKGFFVRVSRGKKLRRIGYKHDLSTSIETLKTPETDWNYDLKGFKVASYLTNVTFLDLELVKEKGECVLKGSVNYLKTKDIDKKLSGCRKVDEFSFNFNDL